MSCIITSKEFAFLSSLVACTNYKEQMANTNSYQKKFGSISCLKTWFLGSGSQHGSEPIEQDRIPASASSTAGEGENTET